MAYRLSSGFHNAMVLSKMTTRTTTGLGTVSPHDQTNTQVESSATATRRLPATTAALSTTELLEQILSHFSIEDLILLRRVSRHWRDVMAESQTLQRAMFLAPEPELAIEWHLQVTNLGNYYYTKERSGTVPESRGVALQSSRFNPLLFERRPDIDSDGANSGQQSVPLFFRNFTLIACHIDLFTQMFISQPPVSRVLLDGSVEVHNEHDIRVADIIKAVKLFDDLYRFISKKKAHILSLVVLNVAFPNMDEENRGSILRYHRGLRLPYAMRTLGPLMMGT